MTHGRITAIGICMGLMVGLLAGWVIGSQVAVRPMVDEIRNLRYQVEITRDDALTARKEAAPQHDEEAKKASAQLQQLQKCAAIRVDARKEGDKVVYHIGDRTVPLENIQMALQDLVTWDGKPELIIIRHDGVSAGDAASVEFAADETKKFGKTYNIEEKPQ